jgi:glycosyltransferase involved in cell wall biosynthesis
MINKPEDSPYAHIVELLRQRQFREAEEEVVKDIRKAPLAPQLWVLLGEALLHQGCGAAARKAFYRAWLLDPQAAWIAGVERKLKETPEGPQRSDIDELLKVKRVSVTIGVIVRDEERSIARCLSSLQGAADEIVVVDCESVDRTAEIASSFPGVKIVQTKWNHDFAALRNEGMRHMTTDWVLWVDADEHLHPDDRNAVREAAGLYDEMNPVAVLYVWQVNAMGEGVHHEFSQTRMFPLGRGLKYHGRIHEQVGPVDAGMYSGTSYRKPVRIRLFHDGYEPEIVRFKDKIKRNLSLLEQMVAEEPENPGWWTYYGRESLAAGLIDQALHGLAEAERTAQDKPAFARLLDVYMLTAKIRIHRKEWDLAEEACRKALARHPDFPDAHFYLSIIKMNQAARLQHEAETALRRSKDSFARYRGTVSPDYAIDEWKADVSLADIAKSAGRVGDAYRLYKQVIERHPHTAADLDKAMKLIETQAAIVRDFLGK